MMKLSRFNFFKPRRSPQKIELQRFVNFDLDTVGWYALGHHRDRVFLAIVKQRGPLQSPFYEIRRVWAEQIGEGITELESSSPNAQPITVIEFYV
jgi:hypothetical protein